MKRIRFRMFGKNCYIRCGSIAHYILVVFQVLTLFAAMVVPFVLAACMA